jgi:cytochrome P450
MFYRVARDHEVRDRLIAEPALVDRAVEETLRLEPPRRESRPGRV